VLQKSHSPHFQLAAHTAAKNLRGLPTPELEAGWCLEASRSASNRE
jgi:hypothetical protein